MIKRILCLAALLFAAATAAPAWATPHPSYVGSLTYSFTNIPDLANKMTLLKDVNYSTYSSDLNGLYDITPLGKEAMNTDVIVDKKGALVFSNTDASKFGTWKTVNIDDTYFQDTTVKNYQTKYSISLGATPSTPQNINKDAANSVSHFSIFQLNQALTLTLSGTKNKLELQKGDLIIGLDDSAAHYDRDDFVLAARKHSATPIPGAAWLLGSGLAGLLGLRRKFTR